MNTISAQRVGRRAGRDWLVRDISLDIAQGEVFGILGRAGSGKTTLVSLIAGTDQPDEGTVDFASGSTDDPWLNARISLAGQLPRLAPDLTVAENLRLFASLWKTPRKGRQSRVSMFTELLGLTEARTQKVSTLSPGTAAAAEVARGLVPKAEVYVMDGLVERLDPPVRRRVWEHMLARKRQGDTFVIAASSGEDAVLCDRLAVLSRGRLAFAGTPQQLAATARSEVMVVESVSSPVVRPQSEERFGAVVTERDDVVEIRTADAAADAARVLAGLSSDIGCLYLRYPTIEDALDRLDRR